MKSLGKRTYRPHLSHVVGLPSPDPQWLFFNDADSEYKARA